GFQFPAPTMNLVGPYTEVTCDLRHLRTRQTGQADGLTLELFAVFFPLWHDTPPAPSWGLTEVSVLAGVNPPPGALHIRHHASGAWPRPTRVVPAGPAAWGFTGKASCGGKPRIYKVWSSASNSRAEAST